MYLPILIPRSKWTVEKPNFVVGDLVLLRESNMVHNQWCRACITRVIPHSDEKVYCLEVRSPDGSLWLRDIGNIYKLE